MNGWEVPITNEPIVPIGWGTDEEDLPPSDVDAEEEEMSTEFYFISREEYEAGSGIEYTWVEKDLPWYDVDKEEGEISTEFYSICREALEACDGMDWSTGEEKKTSVSCFYTEKGNPIYPKVKEKSSLFEIDTSRGVQIFSTGEKFDGVEEVLQYLDSFFSMGAMTLETVKDPEYVPPVEVVLPGTLRRSARFNGWVPGKYYESDWRVVTSLR